MTFIKLTGYYPRHHPIYVRVDALAAIVQNVTNEKSTGSTVHVGAATFHVAEEPQKILAMVEDVLPLALIIS